MLDHDLDKEYNYKDHDWINHQLKCGCIIATCLDIDAAENEKNYANQYLKKLKTLETDLERRNIDTDDGEVKKLFDDFEKELIHTKNEFRNFIHFYRQKYRLPKNIDFNGEFYFIRLQQCKHYDS